MERIEAPASRRKPPATATPRSYGHRADSRLYQGEGNRWMRKTIFVSSTFRDLSEHRRAVWDLLGTFDVNVRGMETFGARTEAPLETCLAEVEQSDVYLGIIGFRLGSIDEVSGKSFTHREYERARDRDLEILIYLRDEEATLRLSDIDLDAAPREKLASFKRTLQENHTVDTFDGATDLVTKLKRALQRNLARKLAEAPTDEFEFSRATAARFLLLPLSVSGSEIRVKVKTRAQPFPASRSLCNAFNLPYGATIGIRVEVTQPGGEPLVRFKEIFAASKRAADLLAHRGRETLDLFVRLQFSPDDIPRSRARFFGEYLYVGPEQEDDDPYMQYHPGEGRAILLFSKFVDENGARDDEGAA